jgi:glycosyltransferase involved in cell wall biosynthesis
MKLISIVTPCYNEAENVEALYLQVKHIFSELPHYSYEHIFIDNASEDNTVPLLKKMAAQDKNIKIIVNLRNFGQSRSPFYGLLQSKGEASILLVADFQDPPALIKQFLQQWEKGWKIVVAVKAKTHENFLITRLRRFYYHLVTQIAEVKLIKNFTGFALYDQIVIQTLRDMDNPNPYLRGLICEIGFPIKQLPYDQPPRTKGVSKNNFFSLYDFAMLGITSHSKIPLRIASIMGFFLSGLSLFIALIFLILKLIFWQHFTAGVAPILMGLFFFSSVQLFFIGILGEYISSIQTQVTKRPLVFEKERINFNER